MSKIPSIDEANKLLAMESNTLTKLKMPIGDSDFRDILNNKCVYVDKTLLVKEVLDSGEKVILITRPRRWGKTLGMSMLKYFFALEVDKQGKEVELNSNRVLFDNLKIAGTDAISEQGKYPVIFISLKEVKGTTYQHVENKLKLVMSSIFSEYKYIGDSIKNNNDNTKFKQILDRTASYEDLTDSIQFLSKLILAYHNKTPFLLLDEYDVPLNNSYNTKYYQEVLDLIRGLFESGIKDNNNIKKAVVTGVFKIAKSGLWTGMNNSSDYSILSDKYSDYFGFTEGEVDTLLIDANIKDQVIKTAVKEWYNGYHIGGNTIYNPWSIINFFSRHQVAPYWVNTESMVAGDMRLSTGLMITEQIHDKINLLIANFGKELTEITINPEVVFSSLQQEADSLWGLLLFGGYLSIEKYRQSDHGLGINAYAKIPNKEVLAIYEDSIYLWVKEKLALNKKSFDELGENFSLEDIESVRRAIDQTIEIYGDRIAEQNESVFHGLIQSICLLKGDKHRLASESYSGFGRIDSIFYPVKGKSDTIIIHEYKIIKELKDEAQLKAVLSKAIWQMYDKVYTDVPLVRNKYFAGEAKSVELRAIVILCDPDSRNGYGCEIMIRNHSIEEMKEIAAAFKSRPLDYAKIDALQVEIGVEVEEYMRIYMPRKCR